MELYLLRAESKRLTLTTRLSDDTQLDWPATLWARTRNAIKDEIFTVFNAYWTQRPVMQVNALEALYREAHQVLVDLEGSVYDIDERLKVITNKMFGLYDFDELRKWCLEHEYLALEKGIKDTYEDNDKPRLTYFTDEYIDLLIFSIMCKGMMPIWGSYAFALNKEIGADFALIREYELLQVPNVIELRPYLKLLDYCDMFAEERVKKQGFSILHGIGRGEMPKFLMSSAVIKKIALFNVSDPADSIVKNTYHVMIEACKNKIDRRRPTNKQTPADNDTRDITISDQYRTVLARPPSETVMAEHYVSDIARHCKHLGVPVTGVMIAKYKKRMTRDTYPSINIYLPIAATIVQGKSIGVRQLSVMTYDPLRNTLIAVAAVLDTMGYGALAELITTTPLERSDPNTLTHDAFAIDANGPRIDLIGLRPALLAELNALWVHQIGGVNPCITTIDNIVREIQSNDWDITHPDINDVRNSLASLFIQQEQQRRESKQSNG